MFSLVAKRQEVGPWRHPRGSAAVILGQYGRSTRAEDHCKYEGLSDNSHFHQILSQKLEQAAVIEPATRGSRWVAEVQNTS
jgi:hypothetical protein